MREATHSSDLNEMKRPDTRNPRAEMRGLVFLFEYLAQIFKIHFMGYRSRVRVRGIEPRSVAWEATVLPLNHTRGNYFKPIIHFQTFLYQESVVVEIILSL